MRSLLRKPLYAAAPPDVVQPCAWDWWFRGLQSGLAQIDDENEPIVLLDGHTSNIPVSLLMSVAKNVGQYQRVVFPLTYHLCPTHNWRSTYSNKKTAKSYNNISKTPYDAIENKIPGYLQKRVINIAFTKKDGVKALNDIDPSSNDDDSDKEKNIGDEKIGNKDNKNKDNNNNLDNSYSIVSVNGQCSSFKDDKIEITKILDEDYNDFSKNDTIEKK